MSDCIFCKIAKGEIPSKKVYEDSKYLAFLDVNPRSKGHTLIIPKKHATTLSDMPQNEAGELFQIVHHIAKTTTPRLGAKGYNIGSNNGEMAGQAVPHVHIHILPRYDTDKHHAGFEAAFQVDDKSKGDIDNTLKTMTQGRPLPPIITSSAPEKPKEEKKENKSEGEKDQEPDWHFKDRDAITEDFIEY